VRLCVQGRFESRDLVSLLAGKLPVTHSAPFNLAVEES
jgi:hypothetical protein